VSIYPCMVRTYHVLVRTTCMYQPSAFLPEDHCVQNSEGSVNYI